MNNKGFVTRADGRLQTTITDPKTGKRIYFYGRTIKEIKQKIFKHQERLERGELFTELSSEWWEEARETLSQQSIRGYLRAKNRADVEFDGIRVKEIQPQDITAYLKSLTKQYTSQKTVDKYRLVLNLILKYAVESGEIPYNPCAVAKLPKNLTKGNRESASVRDEQIIRTSAHPWLLPYFALYTGMRKGEILALQWKDIDFENNVIYVYKSVYHDGNKPFIKGTKTKAGTRVVPLINALKQKLLEQKQGSPGEYIFSDTGDTPLTNKRYTTLFNEYKKETGITCTAHQLRHSFATIAFENNISPKAVQEILGHKQLSTTMDIYTDLRRSHLDKITEELNKAIK